MFYAFHTGVLLEDRYVLNVQKISLEIVEGTKKNDIIKNDCLNGRFNIKGVLENICLANQSKIKTGGTYKLRLHNENKWSILPVMMLDLLNVDATDDKYFRNYTWMFCGHQKPLQDNIGLVPGCNGEVSLDELLNLIGANREQMEREKKIFTAEGGFK